MQEQHRRRKAADGIGGEGITSMTAAPTTKRPGEQSQKDGCICSRIVHACGS